MVPQFEAPKAPQDSTHRTPLKATPLRGFRMLYIVGGAGNADRVDVSDLFANRLVSAGLEVDYVIFTGVVGPSWTRVKWHRASAFVVGRSQVRGAAGLLISKVFEFLADFRVFWLAVAGPYDLIQVRDKYVVAALALVAARIRKHRFTYWLSYPYAEGRILDGRNGWTRFPRVSVVGGRFAAWLLYKVVMPRSDHIFVQSDQMLRDVSSAGVDVSLMSAVPMGVSDDLLESRPRPVEPRTVVYLGTLKRVRRLEVLIEAWPAVLKVYPDAVLTFVGDGPKAQDRDFLKSIVAQNGLESSVRFTGMLSMSDARQRVQEAAVCVSPFYPTPILQSTSPTKLVEYMALGRPVVANEHPEQSRILKESGAGICVEWSAKAFAEAFLALFDDPGKGEQMGQRGRDYVRTHRTYSIIAETLTEEYARLFDRCRRSSEHRLSSSGDLHP